MLEEPADDAGRPEEAQAFEVWPENMPSVRFFSIVSGQWRALAGFAGSRFIGLDYAAVESSMNMHGIKHKQRPRIFEDLRVMEDAALPLLNRRSGG